MADSLKAQGLDEVISHIIPVPPKLLPLQGQSLVLGIEEHQRGAVTKLRKDHPKVIALDEFLQTWKDDAKGGFYTYYDPVLVTARKPTVH